MGWDEIFIIVGAIGGIASVSGGIAAFIGKLVSSRIIQSHQVRLDILLETHKNLLVRDTDQNRLLLKRQELMFEREYAAAADFYRLFNSIVPDLWAPDLDWLEAQARIAGNLGKHAIGLEKFLLEHASALSKEGRTLVVSAQATANRGSLEFAQEANEVEFPHDVEPSEQLRKDVDEFYELMRNADERLMLDLKQGSFSTTADSKGN
uniref:hypothetical protein n=1 Tax=Pararhizobium sp. IMCC3301 TaxID=3067904 RepID=UPI002741034A|nr:hypothetical protein [Pararhizobium sp. IMCC3301]